MVSTHYTVYQLSVFGKKIEDDIIEIGDNDKYTWLS